MERNGGLKRLFLQKLVLFANRGTGTMTKHPNKLKKKRKGYPTQAEIKDLFDYDEEEGILVYKNLYRKRTPLCSLSKSGRLRRISIDGEEYEYPVILWIWYYGHYPDSPISFYDYDRNNYRIENLVTFSMRKKIPLTQERVRFLLDYNPLTGAVRRKIKTGTRCRVGEIENNINKSGYRTISVDGNRYYLHRIIWLWYYGYFPEHVVDHINNNKLDCSIGNLREVTQQCNSRNSLLPYNNKSGVKGVNLIREDGTFCVRISIPSSKGGSSIGRHLCNTKDFTEAVAHRLAAEQCLDWAGCDLNSTAYQYMQNYLQEMRCQTENKEQ